MAAIWSGRGGNRTVRCARDVEVVIVNYDASHRLFAKRGRDALQGRPTSKPRLADATRRGPHARDGNPRSRATAHCFGAVGLRASRVVCRLRARS